MLFVAIPLLMSVRLPLKQKLILVLLFGMGVFVIVAAILTKVYCLVPSLIDYVYMNWYFREATVAILVTNLPLVWSLLRDIFPSLKSWTGGSKRGTSDRYKTYVRSRFSSRWSKPYMFKSYGTPGQTQPSPRSPEFSMHPFKVMSQPQKEVSDISVRQSEEPSERDISDDGSARALRIRQDITVTVEHNHDADVEQGSPPHQHWVQPQMHTVAAIHRPEP